MHTSLQHNISQSSSEFHPCVCVTYAFRRLGFQQCLLYNVFSAKSHQQAASQTAINAKRELWTMRQNVLPPSNTSFAINHLTNSALTGQVTNRIHTNSKNPQNFRYFRHIFLEQPTNFFYFIFKTTVTMCCLAKAWQFLVTYLVNHRTQFTIFYVAVWKQSVFLEEKMLHQFRSNCIGLFL